MSNGRKYPTWIRVSVRLQPNTYSNPGRVLSVCLHRAPTTIGGHAALRRGERCSRAGTRHCFRRTVWRGGWRRLGGGRGRLPDRAGIVWFAGPTVGRGRGRVWSADRTVARRCRRAVEKVRPHVLCVRGGKRSTPRTAPLPPISAQPFTRPRLCPPSHARRIGRYSTRPRHQIGCVWRCA